MQLTRASSAVLKRPPPQNRRRKALPLTPMQIAAKELNASGHKRTKIDWSQYPLGEVPDADVALMAGVSRQVVASARVRLEIAAYRRW